MVVKTRTPISSLKLSRRLWNSSVWAKKLLMSYPNRPQSLSLTTSLEPMDGSSWDFSSESLPRNSRVNPSRGLLIYVDGSYTPKGPGGWSWVAADGFDGVQYASGFVPPPTT